MKNYAHSSSLLLFCFVLVCCSGPSEKPKTNLADNMPIPDFSEVTKKILKPGTVGFPFSITLSPEEVNFYLPALQSFVVATYNGLYIILGGLKVGFHGTSNNPPPFLTTFANDSIWVIDVANEKSYGVPVPKEYWSSLAVTNPQAYQVGNDFYVCGGYAVTDPSQKSLNTTSDHFFKINLPGLVEYVESGAQTPALSAVFSIAIEDDFARVAGGELLVVDNQFYLIGGQDYEGAYTLGRKGTYTNSIRSFTLAQNGAGWALTNKDSLVDSINLHRRDFNLAPFIADDGSLEAILYGGVFNAQDLAYFNPVYISGLNAGKPMVNIGSSKQNCNQYTSAIVPLYTSPGYPMFYGIIGGISYMKYDQNTGGLVIGDNGIPMPFSNLVDFIITDGDTSAEFVQIPPEPLLPGYLGSNASFLPLPQYTADDYPQLLDLHKIMSDSTFTLNIGYMYGGILSDGPTSGTTPKGHVNTYANRILYSVNLTFDLSKIQDTGVK